MWIIVTFNYAPGVASVRYETLLPGIQDIIVAVGNGAWGGIFRAWKTYRYNTCIQYN
jgi:hypothetical protein